MVMPIEQSAGGRSAPPAGSTAFLELCGHRYQVRVEDGERQIAFEGAWLPVPLFVETLAIMGEWDRLCELAKIGHKLMSNATAHGRAVASTLQQIVGKEHGNEG